MKVLLTGHNGAMGKMLIDMIDANPNFSVVAGVDRAVNPHLSFAQFETFASVTVMPDVIIDFSHHSLVPDLLDFAEAHKIPAVICTTGLSDDVKARIQTLSQSVALFQSGNMSVGINLMIALAKKAAEILGDDFDIELIEKHHHRKVDAPSGTALMIADAVNTVFNNEKVYQHGRQGVSAKRAHNEIGIHAVRGGTIVGEHDLLFAGDDELIEIRHSASSRKVFAQGALRAAEYLIHQPAGLYNMNDMLGEYL